MRHKTNSTRFMVIDQNQVAVASLIDLNCHIHPGYFWIWYDASCSKKQLVVAFCQMFSGTFTSTADDDAISWFKRYLDLHKIKYHGIHFKN